MSDLEPEGNTLCNLGTGDFLPADNKAQSFVALRIHDGSRKELEITQYNQADYSAPRKKAGYLCEKEGSTYWIFHPRVALWLAISELFIIFILNQPF